MSNELVLIYDNIETIRKKMRNTKKSVYKRFNDIKIKFLLVLEASQKNISANELKAIVDLICEMDEEIWCEFFLFYNTNIRTNLSLQRLLFSSANEKIMSDSYPYNPSIKYDGLLALCYNSNYIDLFERLLSKVLIGIKNGMAIYLSRALYSFSLEEMPQITGEILASFCWPREWLDNKYIINNYNKVSELINNFGNPSILRVITSIDKIIREEFHKEDSRIYQMQMEKMKKTGKFDEMIVEKQKNYESVYPIISDLVYEMINQPINTYVDAALICITLNRLCPFIEYKPNLKDFFQNALVDFIIDNDGRNGFMVKCLEMDTKYVLYLIKILINNIAAESMYLCDIFKGRLLKAYENFAVMNLRGFFQQ